MTRLDSSALEMGSDRVAVYAVDVGQVINGPNLRSVVGNELLYIFGGEAPIGTAHWAWRPNLTSKQSREFTPFREASESPHRFC